MRRFWSVFVSLLLIASLLVGCSRKAPTTQRPSGGRVVTQVDVTCKKDQSAWRWQYTDQSKMEAILLYLRLLRRGGDAQVDPQRVEGDHYEILLHYSDGGSRVYYQHAEKYLSDNYKPWQTIDPNQAKDLFPLLQSMPSDVL